jgi:hypothetical protein
MHSRRVLAVLALASSAALIVGCGSSSSGGGSSTAPGGSNNSSQTPAAELHNALAALGKGSTLDASIKLGASASDIMALAQANNSSISSTEANAIAGAAISFEVVAPSGKTISDLSGADANAGNVNFSISDNGTNFFSVRALDQKVYIQVDLKDLFSAIGKSAEYQQFSGEAAALPPFLQALVAGKWISLPESSLKSLSSSVPGGTASTPNPAQQHQFLTALESILTQDVTVARTSTGSTDDLTLSGNTQTIAQGLISALTSAVPSVAGELGGAGTGNVPSKNVTIDAQVTGGALSQLSIDLGQFDTKKMVSFPVDVDFARSGPAISAPSGAVAVDPSQLQSLLGQVAGGGLSG